MADEFYTRYKGESHETLWSALQAGDPGQIEGLVTHWKSLESTINGLAASLDRDLTTLRHTWDSDSGGEFARRVGHISNFSRAIGGEFQTVHQGLNNMIAPLKNAKATADDPAETDDNDKTVRNAIIGGAVLGPGGALVGGLWGHNQDEEEKKKAHERTVKVVAELAAQYAISGYPWPVTPMDPPPGMPQDASSTTGLGTSFSTSSSGPGNVKQLGTGSVSRTAGANPGAVDLDVDDIGNGGDAVGVDYGPGSGAGSGEFDPSTGLAGANVNPGDGLLGIAGAAAAGGLAGTVNNNLTMPAPSQGTGYAPFPTGGLNAGTGTINNSGPRVGAGEGPRSASGTRGLNIRADGKGTGTSSAGGRGGESTRGGAGSRGVLDNRQNAMGARGAQGEREEEPGDEHLTWLTEDEMVWRHASDSAPPSVLGGDGTAPAA